MAIEDIKGRLIDKGSLPKLTDLGTFEGLVEFKFYLDAVEYAGSCVHCRSVVAGVVRFEDPKMHRRVRSILEEAQIKQEVGRLMRQNHQCSYLAEGKTDIADWFKSVGANPEMAS